MKISISALGMALFADRNYLDLDTGFIAATRLLDLGLLSPPKHFRVLPLFSQAHLYQKYLREMLPKTGIEDTIPLDKYPDFPLLEPEGEPSKLMLDFIGKAFHFVTGPEWERFERKHREDKENNSPDYDPSFVLYDDYREAFERKTAIEWCEKEGYEWCEWYEKCKWYKASDHFN